ncbi:MAG TPA: NAD-binding protein, partial [Burkholderiales bacterium]|nr:NAD-binding protein [Burkholderiales bacterium]
LLYANGITPTVLDHDADQIETMRRFGWRVFYGDATRLDLLRTAGAQKARVLVLAVDDIDQSVAIARMVREHFPALTVVARARNVDHLYALRDAGVALVERETLDSALMSGRSVLESLGWQPHLARNLALRFRRHNVAQVASMAPHWKDEARRIAAAKQGRRQLEEQFAQEREEAQRRQARAAWSERMASEDDDDDAA